MSTRRERRVAVAATAAVLTLFFVNEPAQAQGVIGNTGCSPSRHAMLPALRNTPQTAQSALVQQQIRSATTQQSQLLQQAQQQISRQTTHQRPQTIVRGQEQIAQQVRNALVIDQLQQNAYLTALQQQQQQQNSPLTPQQQQSAQLAAASQRRQLIAEAQLRGILPAR